MATAVERRYGTQAQQDAFTGIPREWTHDDDSAEIRTHDGSTVGGFRGGGWRQEGDLNVTVIRSVRDKLREPGLVLDDYFGASSASSISETTAACNTALNNAFEVAEEMVALGRNRPKIIIPKGYWGIEAPGVSLPRVTDIECQGALVGLGAPTDNYTILTCGVPDIQTNRGNYVIEVHRKEKSDWANAADWWTETNIGVLLLNLFGCDIDIVASRDSGIGAKLMGEGRGFSMNNVRIRTIRNAHVGVLIGQSAGAGGVAYNNQNHGRGPWDINCEPGLYPGIDRAGVVIDSNGTGYLNNCWTFENIAVQMNPNGGATSRPVIIKSGINNVFQSVRNEFNGSTPCLTIQGTGACRYNTVFDSWGDGGILDETTGGTGQNSNVCIPNGKPYSMASGPRWSSGNLRAMVTEYDGAGVVFLPGFFWATTASGGRNLGASSVTTATSHISIGTGRGMGVHVKTDKHKRFVLGTDFFNSKPGRFYIRCYSTVEGLQGHLITSTATPLVVAMGGTNMSSSSNYGGTWRTNNETSVVGIEVHSSVLSIDVIWDGGAAGADIGSVRIQAYDRPAAPMRVSSGTALRDGLSYASAPPATASLLIQYAQGQMIHNVGAAAGGTPGWVCTTASVVSGSPTAGTWKAMANVAA